MDTQNKQTAINYRRYLRLIWRHKWFALLPTVFFPLLAGFYAMQIKDSFSSTTLILVTPQKVPTNFVPSTVTTGIQERLQTISQQIFSRTRLEQIITEFDLFADKKEDLTPEEVIELMRSRISLKVQQDNSFTLSFVDPNPRMAMLVTNKLASLFIQENLKAREQQAVGTSQFLASEIERYREQVREKEATLFEFRQKHLAEMPEQLTTNNARLNQIQRQIEVNSQTINASRDRRVRVQEQIAEIERRMQEEQQAKMEARKRLLALIQEPPQGSSALGESDEAVALPVDSELAKLREEMSNLRLTHTEKHPDVVKLAARIKGLEEEAQKQRDMVREEKETESALDSQPALPMDLGPVEKITPPKIYSDLKVDLAALEAEINRLSEENLKLRDEAEVYQSRLAATPGRELQIKQLGEDYNNLKAVLESLVDKKIQADLSENLERKQKGEQFRILDPANLPEKPFSPNRLRYLAAGMLLGFCFGPGILLSLDFLNPGFKSEEDAANVIGVPVLVAIPKIVTAKERKKMWRFRGGACAATLVLIIVVAVAVHLKYKPIPQALGDMATQIKTTHWSNMK